ncbi:hypothetical protein DSM107133_00785 [Pseudosulfitobacter sp. DSM 107133]|nr:hypothetical protein DSM107133_00785 [Pseudosulfitobacter sp. DSM 107133]
MTLLSFGHKYPGGVPQGRGQRPHTPARQTGAAPWM